jgi:hypothetical protein
MVYFGGNLAAEKIYQKEPKFTREHGIIITKAGNLLKVSKNIY